MPRSKNSYAFGRVPVERARGEIMRLKRAGMNHTEIADAAGVSRTRVAEIGGSRYPSEMVDLSLVTALKAVPTPPSLRDPDTSTAWMVDANCKGKTLVMFPDHPGGRGNTANWTAARAVCRACTVIDACWAWTVKSFSVFELAQSGAMWAGRTPQEARKEIQQMRRAIR